MIVYKITNKLNGNCYIGQTVKKMNIRWNEHAHQARLFHKKSYIYSAMRKYGIENFYIEEIVSCSTKEELNSAEQYFIGFYNCLSPNGYNLTTGGDSGARTAETGRKISIAKTGKRRPPCSNETRLKLSTSSKGKPKSLEHNKKVSIANTGKIRTKETRHNISKIMTGNKNALKYISEEQKLEKKVKLKAYKHEWYMKNKGKLNDFSSCCN